MVSSCERAMDNTSSPLNYHPVSMTVNGVTKSVLIPLPKSRPLGRPITAKLRDGSSIVIGSGKSAVATVSDKILTVAPSLPAASTLLAGQRPGSLSSLTASTGPVKRTIVTVKPAISRYQLLSVRPTVVTARPRFPNPISTSSAAVAVESLSGQRRIVQISPPTGRCVRLPISLTRPSLLTGGSTGPTRPIILRKNQPPVSRPVRTVVVRPCIRSRVPTAATVTDSSCSPTSTLTVVSSPRTLSHREAIAAGWFTDSSVNNEDLGTTADDSGPPATIDDPVYPVRHIVPMDTDCEHSSDTNDKSQHELGPNSSDSCFGSDTESELQNDDRIVVVDNETQMKVIEIFPNDADTASDDDEENDVKPAVPVKVEPAGNALLDDSRHCSSVSTETAVSDAELSTSREDFVVLAEWTQEEFSTTGITGKPATDTRRRNKRRKRRSRKSKWFRYRRSSALTVYKARRTGGRPKTAEERFGIVDSFVSLPVMRLTKPSVLVRNLWRFVCCYDNQIQRCRCGSVPRSTVLQQDLATTADGSKIRELVDTLGLIQPSMMASGPATLPVQLSGPTSADGVTPLVVRQPDGKLASVVAKRTTPSGTALDANKKKYLLVKTKTGSFLVPVNSLAGASPAPLTSPTTDTPPTPPSPATSSKDVKPAVVSDSSGHRERIQQLKEQMRQQEEQLQSIRSQLSCSAVQKFDLDF